MTNDEINAALAVCEAATPEPWVVADVKELELRMEHGGYPNTGYSHWGHLRPADAAFAVAARTGWPAALKELKAWNDAFGFSFPASSLGEVLLGELAALREVAAAATALAGCSCESTRRCPVGPRLDSALAKLNAFKAGGR